MRVRGLSKPNESLNSLVGKDATRFASVAIAVLELKVTAHLYESFVGALLSRDSAAKLL